MPWDTVTLKQLAKELGVNYSEVREKQRLIDLIVKTRISLSLSQADLGKMVKVSQPRIAKIESGIGTRKVTFDVLFQILSALGYDYEIRAKRGKMAA